MSQENKEIYLDLVKSIERDGVDDLVSYIESTDFFEAPSSTKFHLCKEGGLCEHSLNVYYNMLKLSNTYRLNLDLNSVKIVSLFHDLSKSNYYEKYFQNKKLYSESGSKNDELGRFDWVSVLSYKTKEPEVRQTYGDHGFNSFMSLSKFIPLTEEEIVAITNHHIGMDNGFVNRDLNTILNKYPLLTILHLADMLAVYIDENDMVKREDTNGQDNTRTIIEG